MLFRIQSIYLFTAFLVAIAIGISSFETIEMIDFKDINDYVLLAFGLSAAMSLFSLVQYKSRLRQFIINRLNIILQVSLLGLMLYRIYTHKEVYSYFEKIAPLGIIILLSLANRFIKKDEDLIRSLDRIR